MSARDWARAIERTQRLRDMPSETLPRLVLAVAATRGAAPALIGADDALSYAELAMAMNRQARWALQHGLAAGDVVALLMPNCPAYVAIWLGLTQIGCVVALLNTGQPAEALAHAIAAAGARGVIAAPAMRDRATAAVAAAPGVHVWVHATSPGLSGAALTPAEQRPPAAGDRALLIYTSGTTGLPKAAHVTHARVLEWSAWFAGLIDATPDDRLYDCLPLYHSTGGVVAIGCMLLAGGAVVIRDRFSASRFWPDVTESGCTIVQYIGELCRYLLAAPPCPAETAHTLRLCCGNGLRADVWQAFAARFRIPRILEFYAATEGSVSLYNVDGRPGAIGRVPGYLAHRFPVALIQVDPHTLEPLRDSNGLCIRCAADEPGEAIGPIGGRARFDGYTDPAATARKLLTGVFAPGDRWFRTGDLMRRDAAGFYYFVDRLGDTFRWKGENVSTSEVEAVLTACPGVVQAVVYGVEIPGTEGRAGMAALVVTEAFTLPALRATAWPLLAPYARPLFIRLCTAIAATGTFKPLRAALARDGYAAASDPVWFDDQQEAAFVPCDPALIATLPERRL
jgi:fatty-acyl-CoA synthase